MGVWALWIFLLYHSSQGWVISVLTNNIRCDELTKYDGLQFIKQPPHNPSQKNNFYQLKLVNKDTSGQHILTNANADGCSFTVCCCYFGCENVPLHCFEAVYIFILCVWMRCELRVLEEDLPQWCKLRRRIDYSSFSTCLQLFESCLN